MTYTISWPVPQDDGSTKYRQASETTLSAAESWARIQSQGHGHATINDRVGHVATYINDERWAGAAQPTRTVVPGP